MLFLCLAVLSSAAISLIMRLSAHRVTARLSMLCANYLVCALLGAVYCGFRLVCPEVAGFSGTLGLGVLSGVLYLVSFVLFQWNTAKNGVVLSSVFMKLGLLVPIALSVVFFHEVPTWAQIAGFVIALAAIVVINGKSEGGAGRIRWPLFVMLLLCGGADAMSKVFEVLGTAALADQFLFFTFAVALVLCVGVAAAKKERPGVRELLFGAVLGVPNFFSSKFLLLALKELPAVVVYPTFSIATMLIVTLAGVLLFQERLGKHQWLALGAILAALLLLNI